VDKACVWIFAS